jgi:acetyl-CoA acetyltransferase family protein
LTSTVILSAVRTPIGTSFKGSLAHTSAFELAEVVLSESVRRSGLAPGAVDDIVLAESGAGGGFIARHAAVVLGMTDTPGMAVNRACSGSLVALGVAAGSIAAGMDRVVVAGGTHSTSTQPVMRRRVPGTQDEWVENWRSPSHPNTPEAPNQDMALTIGWNTAQQVGISREEMDAWALRSHQRAIAAIDAGTFDDEIVAVDALMADGARTRFAVDEHPRRTSTAEKLASLKPLHPEIDGFSITAGNSSGVNDAASALVVAHEDLAEEQSATVMGRLLGWAAAAGRPERNGLTTVDAIEKVLSRTGRSASDVALWEINEAFACVPIAVVRKLGLDEEQVNIHGSGCSLGHPVAATGARMVTTLIHDLRRRGGGLGVAAMCAAGGQAGAVLVEV